jgi:hypothetical protein
MSKATIRTVGAVIFGIALQACASDGDSAAGPCADDLECKGDRVCERGVCVDPAQTGGSAGGTGGGGGANASGMNGTVGVFWSGPSPVPGLSAFGVGAIFRKDSVSGCTADLVGPCAVLECPFGNPDPPSDRPDAGVITFTSDGQTVELAADQYSFADDELTFTSFPNSETWAPAAPIAVVAVGAEVPSFQAELLLPPQATLTFPLLDAYDPEAAEVIHIDDWTSTWEGLSTGSMVITFVQLASSSYNRVTCTFEGAAGMGTVPAAALSPLAYGGGELSWDAVNTTSLTAGEWAIQGVAISRLRKSGGDSATTNFHISE